jgi:hypothetical protein
MTKKLFISFLILLSCNHDKPAALFPVQATANGQRIVYEGRVPIGEGRFLYLELSLLPGSIAGEGHYALSETIEGDTGHLTFSSIKGIYSTSFGHGPNGQGFIVHLQNSAVMEGVKRVYSTPTSIREEHYRRTDLLLQSEGDDKLVLLDKESRPLTNEAEYNLRKRTSRVFTVEGYFAHKGDTAEFYEVNTGKH